MTVAGDIGVIGDANVDGSMNVVGNVLLTSGSSAGSRFISGRRRYQPTQSRGVGGGGWGGVSGNVNMGNNLSVVGDIDTTGDLILIRTRVRYGGTQNSNFIFRTISQRIIVLDFVIGERTGKNFYV
jgi:hypothetical protein